MNFPYHITNSTLTVFIDGRAAKSIPRTSEGIYQAVIEALNNPETTLVEMLSLLNPQTAAVALLSKVEGIELRDGKVFFGGEEVHTELARRITEVVKAGLDPEPWIKFATKVYENPFREGRAELYTWLERGNMPITVEGDFLAYKRVRADYMDCHSGTVSYKIGETALMKGERPEHTTRELCGTGLHFCSYDYLRSFSGERTLLVQINPADVISVPRSETHKGRCSKMLVVDELEDGYLIEPAKRDFAPVVQTVTVSEKDEPAPPAKKAPVSKKGKRKAAKAAAKAPAKKTVKPPRYVVVETAAAGNLTKTGFNRLLKEHGSQAGIARHFGISAGTVQQWKTKLGL